METNTHITISKIEEKEQEINTDRKNFSYWPSPFRVIFTLTYFLCWTYWPFLIKTDSVWIVLLFITNIAILFYSFVKMESYYKSSTEELTKHNESLLELTVWINNIDEILNIIEIIWGIMQKIDNRKRIFKIFCNQDAFDIYTRLIKNEIELISTILNELYSDLQLRIAQQQLILEYSKSEVENNITWITELSTVSELQKARLDRQIEQFEELQRVLIKA